MLFQLQHTFEMTIFPVNKANVYTTVFIDIGACLLELKQDGQDDLYRSPEYQTSFELVCFLVPEKKFEIDFPDGDCDSHLEILTGMILAIITLQITLILPTRFPVSCPFVSGEVQNRVARWQPSWKSYRNNFNCF